jgi:hypothetical protein
VSFADSIVKYLTANPSVVASCIAVFGSIIGAISGSALTLYFTGHNQRKHLALETILKKERELEEQKRLLLLELMDAWKEAFHHAGEYFALTLEHRVRNDIPDSDSSILSDLDTTEKMNKSIEISENLRHLRNKFLLYYAETPLYNKMQKFHNELTEYSLHLEDYSIEMQREKHKNLQTIRYILVKEFREQLGVF